MRLMPILSAILVTAFLYYLIIERDDLLALAQAENNSAEVTQVSETAPARISVVVERSHAQTIDSAVILRGRTEAARQVVISAETSGAVISEPIRKGADIAQGDLLCELDPGTRRSSLEEAQARLNEARARLPEAEARVPEANARLTVARAQVAEAQSRVAEAQARLEEARINQNAASRLSQDGFASEARVANADASLAAAEAGVTSANAALEGSQAGISSAEAGVEGAEAGVEGARAGIQSAEAAVAAAERELERLQITAPFGGLLESDTAETGSLMQPGSPCATIIQLDPVKLVGFVPEVDVSKISLGTLAGARLTGGTEVRGQVSFISRSADEATRTFRVEVEVPNPDLAIRDGETAEILIASDGQDAHLIASSAMTLNDDGEIGIRAIDDQNVTMFLPVRVLRDTIDGVWVSGLPETVDIIVVGQEYVREGVVVNPTYREGDE